MSRRLFTFSAHASLAVLAFAVAAPGALAREVTLDASCRPQVTPVEQRVLDKAGEGIGALREFLFARRAIYEMPIYDTAVWAENLGRQRAQCLRAQARSSAVGTGSAHVPADEARVR